MKSGAYRNVCDVIVPNNLCSGCGICVGICSAKSGAIRMEWNKYGEYIPVELADRCTECGLCLLVCPFWDQDNNETSIAEYEFGNCSDIHRNPVVGLYLNLFSGYSRVNGHRRNGAGGGLTTWLLENLLIEGVVDKVVCVTHWDDPNTLFRFAILDSVEDIRTASRSVYYPVELSSIISEIMRVDAKYAVVGLPCVLKGLRLAARNDERLCKRIIIMVGLVCGQMKSKFFAEYLTAKVGGKPSGLRRVTFRVKDETRHHLDHRFEFISGSDDEMMRGHIYQSDGMSRVWGHDWFKLNACNFCDDITAEVADVTFGDAIAESYSYGNMGANFAIVRSPLVHDLLSRGANFQEIVLDTVSIDAVVERQKGLIFNKRKDLGHRLYDSCHKKRASYVPDKRVTPKRRVNLFENRDMKLREAMRVASRSIYAKYRYQPNVVEEVENAIKNISDGFQRHSIMLHLYRLLCRLKRLAKN